MHVPVPDEAVEVTVPEAAVVDGHNPQVLWQYWLTNDAIPTVLQMETSLAQLVTASTQPPWAQNPQADGQSAAMMVLQVTESHWDLVMVAQLRRGTEIKSG